MKELRLTFTDDEFRRLKKAREEKDGEGKTRHSWKSFILTLVKGVSVKKDMTGFKK